MPDSLSWSAQRHHIPQALQIRHSRQHWPHAPVTG